MRYKPHYLIVALLAVGSLPANAAGSGGATPGQQATAKSTASSVAAPVAAKEKKICKRLETSGSRLAERVCLTDAQWKKVESEI